MIALGGWDSLAEQACELGLRLMERALAAIEDIVFWRSSSDCKGSTYGS